MISKSIFLQHWFLKIYIFEDLYFMVDYIVIWIFEEFEKIKQNNLEYHNLFFDWINVNHLKFIKNTPN